MKNFIQEGDILDIVAPYDTTSGQGVKKGVLFGVAVADADSGDGVRIKCTGVFELTKVGSQAWTVGTLIYWDDGNRRCTTVDTDVPIGAAVAAVGSGAGETTGIVRLTGQIVGNLVTS